MGVADYFSGMSDAKSMGGGQYFKGEGKFLVKTKRIFVHVGHKGKNFITEFEVLESTSEQDPVGVTRSWVAPLEGERSKYSFGDIKNLIFALTGEDPKNVGDPSTNPKLHQEATQIVMAACDSEFAKKHNIDPELLINREVRLETFTKTTRPKPGQTVGGTFTVHAWAPVE